MTLLFKTASKKSAIADLHCDLLWYLSQDPKRTAHDLEVRCAIPQLNEGCVKLQTLAVFAETNAHSVETGTAQAAIFKNLPKLYPDSFYFVRQMNELEQVPLAHKIAIVPAIENASAICSEQEDLSKALERLTALQRKIGKLLYVSLTWNSENRFGGGAFTKIGLKSDGKQLVDYLCAKGIALDFSHTSDYLAFDLLNYIDRKGLRLPILASHSNMRAIANFPRNLSDEIAKEIIQRKGVIGMNFIRYLVGKESPHFFSKQLEHLLSLGGGESICFGADFFCIEDLPKENRKSPDLLFFPSYGDAGTYGKVLDLWKKEVTLSDQMMENICHVNFIRFAAKVILDR